MFIARGTGDIYNILPTNFGLLGGEYLQSLEERQKWTSRRRNFRVDDIVLLKQSDVPQNQWSVGRVIDI